MDWPAGRAEATDKAVNLKLPDQALVEDTTHMCT